MARALRSRLGYKLWWSPLLSSPASNRPAIKILRQGACRGRQYIESNGQGSCSGRTRSDRAWTVGRDESPGAHFTERMMIWCRGGNINVVGERREAQEFLLASRRPGSFEVDFGTFPARRASDDQPGEHEWASR